MVTEVTGDSHIALGAVSKAALFVFSFDLSKVSQGFLSRNELSLCAKRATV